MVPTSEKANFRGPGSVRRAHPPLSQRLVAPPSSCQVKVVDPEVTYLACISDHDEQHENRIGRLSMWRAYGGPMSVALVLNNRPFLAPTDVLHARTSPVLYADPPRFNAEFERLVSNLEEAGPVLNQLGRQVVHDRLFNAFLFATLCTKHPGFREVNRPGFAGGSNS
jgi:hypothetical protein